MSKKDDLVNRAVRLIVELQDAAQLLDEFAADELQVNLTDLRCLRLVIQEGVNTASQLAVSAGLTRPAITAALDRLEAAGLTRRVVDPVDRRRKLVEPTTEARQQIARIWAPVEREGRRELSEFDVGELRTIVHFLEKSIALQARHATRVSQRITAIR